MATPDAGILTTDRALVVRSWDRWLEAATGIASEAACGAPLADLAPRAGSGAVLEALQRVLDHGAAETLSPALHGYLVPCPAARPSAHFSRMQQRVTLSPLRGGAEVLGVVVRIEDVTERREQERDLARRLKSGDEQERLDAAAALAEADAPAAVLSVAFSDESWQVRRAASAGASSDTSDEAAELLVGLVRERHRDLSVLNAALSAIADTDARVLPRLLPLLRDPDDDLRIYVALALGMAGSPGAVGALLEAAADPNPNVAFHAIEALGRLQARPAAEALARVAESGDFFLGSAALEALGEIGDASVAARLLPLLEDDMLSEAAASAIGRSGAEDVVVPLLSVLTQEGRDAEPVLRALAEIFERFEQAGPGGEVIAALAGHSADAILVDRVIAEAERAPSPAAVRVLGWLDDERVPAVLAGAVEAPETRAAAVEGLVRRGDTPALLGALPRLTDEARSAAVIALGRIGHEGSVPALLPVAAGDDPDLAILAVAALAGIGSSAAFEDLIALLDAPRPALRQAVVGALNSIGDSRMRPKVAEMLSSVSPRLREAAVRIAGYFAYADCTDAAIALATDDDPGVRRAVAEHVSGFEDPRVPAVTAALARDPHPTVRAAAVRALPMLGPASAGLLADAMADPDLWVRYYAARGSAAVADPSHLDALIRLAGEDPVPPVRIAAIEALAARGGARVIAALEAATRDADPEVAGAGLRGLSRAAGGDHPLVTRALRSADPARQREVLEGILPGRAASAVVDAIQAMTGSRDDATIRAAANALAGSPDGIRALCDLAQRPSWRDAAISALLRVPAERRGEIVAAAGDPAAHIRDRAIEVLARSGWPQAVPALSRALEDPSADVRRRASHALAAIDLRDAVLEGGRPASAQTDAGGR